MAKNYASKVIAIAKAEVGYLEKKTNKNLDSKTANAGNNNYTKYANDFDKNYPNFYNGKKNGFPWCDVFVDWCMVKAFGVATALKLLGQPEKSCGAGCSYSANYYKKINRFYSTGKFGDQIFFKDSSGEPCHTGFVYKVDDTKVYTVEGNTSSESGVVANGGAVAFKSYSKSYNRIYGYGRPNYDAEPVENSVTATTTNSEKEIVYTVKKGDTLSTIASKYGTTYMVLADYNGIANPNKICEGQKIKIPGTTGTAKKTYSGTFPKLPEKGYLEKGDTGTQVRNLQKFLNWYGNYSLSVDGDLGSKTDAAIRDFQGETGLTVDGQFGIKSLTKAKSIKK